MYVNIFVSVYVNIFITIYLNTRHNGFEYIAQNVCPITSDYICIAVSCSSKRIYVFGRRDVVESFRFHLTLVTSFLKQHGFYYKL